jgi:hypothetical protein
MLKNRSTLPTAQEIIVHLPEDSGRPSVKLEWLQLVFVIFGCRVTFFSTESIPGTWDRLTLGWFEPGHLWRRHKEFCRRHIEPYFAI